MLRKPKKLVKRKENSSSNREIISPEKVGTPFWLKFFVTLSVIMLVIGVFVPFRNNDATRRKEKNNSGSYDDVLKEICDQEDSIVNLNIPRTLAVRPMTDGIKLSEQNVVAKSCAELNEIAAKKGLSEAYKGKYEKTRHQCELANDYIRKFENEYRRKLDVLTASSRDQAIKVTSLFENELNNKVNNYRIANKLTEIQSKEISKAIESLTHFKKIAEVAAYSYKYWGGNCGEHSYVAAARILVAQLKNLIPEQEILHFTVKGLGINHEFLLLLKKDVNLDRLPRSGKIYTLDSIKAFIETHGDSICDSWNFFEKGGFRHIDEIKTSRFYGFAKLPMEWPEAFYKRLQKFDELNKEQIPFVLYVQFSDIYEKLKKSLFEIAEKFENINKPETALVDPFEDIYP